VQPSWPTGPPGSMTWPRSSGWPGWQPTEPWWRSRSRLAVQRSLRRSRCVGIGWHHGLWPQGPCVCLPAACLPPSHACQTLLRPVLPASRWTLRLTLPALLQAARTRALAEKRAARKEERDLARRREYVRRCRVELEEKRREEEEAALRLEMEKKAREEAERQRKLDESLEKQRQRDAELEAKARAEKEAAASAPAPAARSSFVPPHLRKAAAAAGGGGGPPPERPSAAREGAPAAAAASSEGPREDRSGAWRPARRDDGPPRRDDVPPRRDDGPPPPGGGGYRPPAARGDADRPGPYRPRGGEDDRERGGAYRAPAARGGSRW
jgi:hypothetical protein